MSVLNRFTQDSTISFNFQLNCIDAHTSRMLNSNNVESGVITRNHSHGIITNSFIDKIGMKTPTLRAIETSSFRSTPESYLGSPSTPDGFPKLEPLKITLDSDDSDSSIDSGSSCVNEIYNDSSLSFSNHVFHKKNCNSCSTTEAINPPDVEFHRKRPLASLCQNNAMTGNNAPISSPLAFDQTIQDLSSHSVPSLMESESSSLSSIVSHANKKPRTLHYSPAKKKKGVTIRKTVTVVPIPSRSDYSHIVRDRLWTTSTELAVNAARNTVEFASEGWNWRNVLEDENMLVHQENGELIHPIHIQNALTCSSNQPQEITMEEFKLNLSLISSLSPNSQIHSLDSRSPHCR